MYKANKTTKFYKIDAHGRRVADTKNSELKAATTPTFQSFQIHPCKQEEQIKSERKINVP